MKITDRLELIDQLVSEQKPPAEIRGHILAIREEIEAYAEKADHLGRLETENAKLIEENAKLKTAPSGSWGSSKRIPGRMDT
jgi:hypothetical protein